MHNESLTNIFWGLFLIWFGFIAALQHGDLGLAVNNEQFALGTGILLLIMNLTRSLLRLRLSILTIGLGSLLIVGYAPIIFFHVNIPFLPALIVIAGVALIIGAIRTRNFRSY